MNSKSSARGSSTRSSRRSLQALMYAATLGIAILGALTVGLAARSRESHGQIESRKSCEARIALLAPIFFGAPSGGCVEARRASRLRRDAVIAI
jgi:hypothetical protein